MQLDYLRQGPTCAADMTFESLCLHQADIDPGVIGWVVEYMSASR